MAWMNPQQETSALLIDGANCYETSRRLGYAVDYAKVLNLFSPRQAYYFTALPENDKENNPNSIFKMLDYINYNGYSIVSKRMKSFLNNGIVSTKGNMDVEIALYILKSAEWANHIILFTGDSDFRMAVEEVQNRGVKVTVVSALGTNPPMVGDELRRQSNVFIDMCDPKIRSKIEWSNR